MQSISEQRSLAKTQLLGFFSAQYGIALAKDIIHTADTFMHVSILACPERHALPQLAHESGQFRYMVSILARPERQALQTTWSD